MMAVEIRWNPNALYEIRSAPGVVAAVEQLAEGIAAEANDRGKGTYAVSSQQGEKRPQGRWRATVVTADWQSMRDNAKHNTLINSMYRG